MTRVLDDLAQDIRYGLRGLRVNPGFALGVIVTLALGIGANTAMFSVVDALLLRPLPYGEPHELVNVMMATSANPAGQPNMPYAVARGWSERAERPVLLHSRHRALYTGGTEPQMLQLQVVTPEFTEVLGVAPTLGRGFMTEDADLASADVVLLENAFWRAEFGGDRAVIGRTVRLNGSEYTVIGVMPEGFRFPAYSTTPMWIPMRVDGSALGEPRTGLYIEAVMRVSAADRERIGAQAATVGGALFRQGNVASETTLRLQPLDERRGGNRKVTEAMLLLSGAVVLILIVACVNMVNLLLARASARTDEIAVRVAIGAARGRIMRQIATEAMLLALLGGAAAVVVALIAVRGLQGIIPSSITFFAPHPITIEQRTLAFTFTVAVVTGLIFGLFPACIATDWARPTSEGGLTRYARSTRRRRRLRSGLVVVEIAFSVMLVITASLLINSFVRLIRVDPGIQLKQLAVFRFDISPTIYPIGASRGAYLRRLEDHIRSVPGVESATLTGGLPPYTEFSFGLKLEPAGEPAKPLDNESALAHTLVGGDFFAVTGARLLAGRPFLATEDHSSSSVIIDEDLARRLWPAAPAVGQRFRLLPEWEWLTVVGVMADLRLMGPDERRGAFSLLYPIGSYDEMPERLAMAIRTRGDPRQVLSSIRAAVREVDANQPIQELSAATTYYAQAVDMPRFLSVVLGMLAGLALALAAVGVYGVLAFGVAQRRHELGMRVVLGASANELSKLVFGEGLGLAAMGITVGLGGALLSTRIVQGVLYNVEAVDLPTFAIAVSTVLLITGVATLYPARRAARLNPLEIIRTK